MKSDLALDKNKIAIGDLKRLKVIEPIWTYPCQYNSNDPLAEDFYRPTSWLVMSKEVHSSRLLTIVSREMPDLLKPAYMFGGLSLSQMGKPYVDYWMRTRKSVSDMIAAFSVMVLKTNMGQILNNGAAESLANRIALFNRIRDNRGLMALDKESEELANISAPLGSLDKLQAQSQEHMAAVWGVPIIVLLGITPSGLNASSEGEIRVFYQWIESQQEAIGTPAVTRLLEVVQLSLFGEIDHDIGFTWIPLWSMDAVQAANVQKLNADTDAVLIDKGVIAPHEARVRVAGDEDAPYASLDVDDDPEPPMEEGLIGKPDDGGED